MNIREADPGDSEAILQLIRDLAEYEKAPQEAVATIEDIRKTIFSDHPTAFCHVAEVDGVVVGIAIWFLNYSTWLGQPGIYLGDLYVRPENRGAGIGLALMKTLANICVSRGYKRFQWWVLDWNSPAIEFYRSLGAVAMDEWTVYRVSGEALKDLGK